MPIKNIRAVLMDLEKKLPSPVHGPCHTSFIERLNALEESKLIKSSGHPSLPLSI